MKELLFKLFCAYFSARKNKRQTISQLSFELNYENNLLKLYQEIENFNYQIKGSHIFLINQPVKREILAANFYDRVVHHLIYSYLYPIIDKKLIYDCYSCRERKGPLFGIKRAKKFLRQATNNYQTKAYLLKLDISGYFMNLNKKILYQTLINTTQDELNKLEENQKNILHYLIKKNIFHKLTKNYIFKGKMSDYQGLPKNKSLFHSPKNCGLAIGNLTSQLYGNLYLNPLDHYIKRELKIKYYGRYVDDLILFHSDKDHLLKSKEKIEKKLKKDFNLEVNKKKAILKEAHFGFYFLGQYILPHRSYLSKRIKNNFYQAINSLNKDWLNPSLKTIKKTINIINSYLGLSKHCSSYNLRKKILKQLHPHAYHFLELNDSLLQISLKPKVKSQIKAKKLKHFLQLDDT